MFFSSNFYLLKIQNFKHNKSTKLAFSYENYCSYKVCILLKFWNAVYNEGNKHNTNSRREQWTLNNSDVSRFKKRSYIRWFKIFGDF